ncbi:uncharacterized protein V2V93DRAFT_369192 [Kockiozyma suomiensis]|uniref:uncharacterized protein n=1 Tax=Kockiozyma suomiensis TaxID=1337062 RepID=UPI0033440F43
MHSSIPSQPLSPRLLFIKSVFFFLLLLLLLLSVLSHFVFSIFLPYHIITIGASCYSAYSTYSNACSRVQAHRLSPSLPQMWHRNHYSLWLLLREMHIAIGL